MPSILLTFENDQQREEFVQAITDITGKLDPNLGDNEETKRQVELINKTFHGLISLDQAPNPAAIAAQAPAATPAKSCGCTCAEKHALFVSGKKMIEGTLQDMQRRFKQEVVQHSGSVQVRSFRDGAWCVVMQRPKH